MSTGTREADVAARMTEIGQHLGARTGHMFGHPALYADRRLAVCSYGSGLGLKLPADRVGELIASGRAVPFQPYGKPPMREWVYWPVTTSDDVDELEDLIAEAMEFAGTPSLPAADPPARSGPTTTESAVSPFGSA